MKIGLFIDNYYPEIDGMIKVVDSYATLLSKRAKVYVFAPKIGKKAFKDDFAYEVIRCDGAIHPITKSLKVRPKNDKEFLERLYNLNLDIVHIHTPFELGKIGIEYARTKKIPVISTIHSQYDKELLYKYKLKLISKLRFKKIIETLNQVDFNFTMNNIIAKNYFEHGLKSMPRILKNGTDFKCVEPDFVVNKLRNMHHINDDEKVLLFVGKIDEMKNIFFLLDVMLKLKDKDFKFKMFFIGSGPDFDKLERKIKKIGLEDKVILIGKVLDRDLLANYYKLADLFVYPSLYDSSNLVQIESASQKTPTLFIKNCMSATNVIDGVNGYISNHNANDFSDKIINIFSEGNYNIVSFNVFNELYVSWDKIIKDVYDIYERLINGKNLNQSFFEMHMV